MLSAWQDDNNSSIYARRFDKSHKPLTENLLINKDSGTFTTQHIDIDIDYDGDFVVVWDEFNSTVAGAPDNYRYVKGRKVYKDNKSKKFTLDTALYENNFIPGFPEVAMDSAGNFVTAYNSYDKAYKQNF